MILAIEAPWGGARLPWGIGKKLMVPAPMVAFLYHENRAHVEVSTTVTRPSHNTA